MTSKSLFSNEYVKKMLKNTKPHILYLCLIQSKGLCAIIAIFDGNDILYLVSHS